MAPEAPEFKISKVVKLKSYHLDITGNFNGAIKEERGSQISSNPA